MSEKLSLWKAVEMRQQEMQDVADRYSEIYKKGLEHLAQQNGIPKEEHNTFAMGYLAGYLAKEKEVKQDH